MVLSLKGGSASYKFWSIVSLFLKSKSGYPSFYGNIWQFSVQLYRYFARWFGARLHSSKIHLSHFSPSIVLNESTVHLWSRRRKYLMEKICKLKNIKKRSTIIVTAHQLIISLLFCQGPSYPRALNKNRWSEADIADRLTTLSPG